MPEDKPPTSGSSYGSYSYTPPGLLSQEKLKKYAEKVMNAVPKDIEVDDFADDDHEDFGEFAEGKEKAKPEAPMGPPEGVVNAKKWKDPGAKLDVGVRNTLLKFADAFAKAVQEKYQPVINLSQVRSVMRATSREIRQFYTEIGHVEAQLKEEGVQPSPSNLAASASRLLRGVSALAQVKPHSVFRPTPTPAAVYEALCRVVSTGLELNKPRSYTPEAQIAFTVPPFELRGFADDEEVTVRFEKVRISLLVPSENWSPESPHQLFQVQTGQTDKWDGKFPHPHVDSNYFVCMGEHQVVFNNALCDGRLEDCFGMVMSMLTEYSPEFAYASISLFHPEARKCTNCGTYHVPAAGLANDGPQPSDLPSCAHCENAAVPVGKIDGMVQSLCKSCAAVKTPKYDTDLGSCDDPDCEICAAKKASGDVPQKAKKPEEPEEVEVKKCKACDGPMCASCQSVTSRSEHVHRQCSLRCDCCGKYHNYRSFFGTYARLKSAPYFTCCSRCYSEGHAKPGQVPSHVSSCDQPNVPYAGRNAQTGAVKVPKTPRPWISYKHIKLTGAELPYFEVRLDKGEGVPEERRYWTYNVPMVVDTEEEPSPKKMEKKAPKSPKKFTFKAHP